MKTPAKLALSATLLAVLVLTVVAVPQYRDVLSQMWGLNQLYYFEFRRKLKSRVVPAIDKRFAFATSDSLAAAPSSDRASGAYPDGVVITLKSDQPRSIIRYTLDGSTPTSTSPRYRRPVAIDSTTVVRFRAFRAGYLPSETVTHTYIVDQRFSLPVLSVVTDPVALWNRYSGLHTNAHRRGSKWERLCAVELIGTDGSHVEFPAWFRLHGGDYARSQPKKGFRLRYDTADLVGESRGAIITEKGPRPERSVILRPMLRDHNARLGDELFNALYREIGGFVSRADPVLLLLNGQMWGHYNVHERINEEFLQRRFGAGDYVLIRNVGPGAEALAGRLSIWEETLEFFERSHLSDDEVYARAKEVIDIQNTTDYWLLNIFVGNYDWPDNNSYVFRRLDDPSSKWRWIAWDSDFAFRPGVLGINTLAWATRDEPRTDLVVQPGEWRDKESGFVETLVVRRLLESAQFKRYFVTRFCDLLNSTLRPDHVGTKLDSIVSVRAGDLESEWRRWPGSKERFENGIRDIRHFAVERPDVILGYFRERFDLGDLHTIRVENHPANGGEVQINSVVAGDGEWSGRYFEGMPLVLLARPAEGYDFVGWSDPGRGRDREIVVDVRGPIEIRANYRAR